MNDAALRLLDAICAVFDTGFDYGDHKGVLSPAGGLTWCNAFVARVCGRLGYSMFLGLTANEMMDLVRGDQQWSPVDMEDAQDLANAGHIVVAGQTGDPHGHVVIVRPGRMVYSQKWQRRCPVVANVGGDVFIGRGVNWSVVHVPEFYFWRGGPLI